MRINLKLVTILLALVLWIYVNIIVSPMIRRTVTTKVEYRNMPQLMRVLPQAAMAEVVLTGTRRDFIIAGRDLVQVSVDLYSLRPGSAMLPLKVTTPPGLTMVSIKPAQIEVTGEPLIRREFDISAEIKGQTDEGFLSEMPNLTPRRVTVEGSKEAIERIAVAQVVVTLNNARNSVSESCPVLLLATSGETIEGVKVVPEKVNVDITVKAGYPGKVIRVMPQFINKPPEGYRLEGFDVTPPDISITGPGRILEQMSELLTMPIDLAMMTSSGSITALLKPPVETVRVAGTGTVIVGIRLTASQVVRQFAGLPLTVKNSSNQHCLVSPSSYTLILRGFVEQLDKVSRADMNLVLDMRKMAPGSYAVDLPCPVGVPDKVEVVEIQPKKVQIEITEIQPDPPRPEGAHGVGQ
ncbi:MAG TPA: CdaR family protein [Candidatus Ozemobacteraceae bacterium]|nr:CdaR family protein [Candidatus Ozemobacteraceae bacterium]